MAQQNWFYKKDGQQHGPVPAKELKRLADEGDLQADDPVRSESMEKWVRAKSVKGLVRAKASTTAGPPPIPNETPPEETEAATKPTLLQKLKSSISGVADATKSAGIVAARQAEIARVKTIDLPKAYRRLGEEIRQRDLFRTDFPEIHQRIDVIEQKLASLQNSATPDSPEGNISGKAKSIARMTKRKADEGTLRLTQSKLLNELGTVAFRQHDEKAGSQNRISEITKLQQRLVEIEESLQSSTKKSSNSLTPKRIAIVAAVALALFLTTFIAVVFRFDEYAFDDSSADVSAKYESAFQSSEKVTIRRPSFSISNVSGSGFDFSSDGNFLVALVKKKSSEGTLYSNEPPFPEIYELAKQQRITASISWDDVTKLGVGRGTIGKAGTDLPAAINLNAEFNRSGRPIETIRSAFESYPVVNRFSPFGSVLISGTPDKAIEVFDIHKPTSRVELKDPESKSQYFELGDVRFSPDGRWAAVDRSGGKHECTIWNLKTGKLALDAEGYAFHLLDFDQRSQFFALAKKGSKLEIIDLSSMSPACTGDYPSGTSFAGFSSDGESFAIAGHGNQHPLVLVKKSRSGTVSKSYSIPNLRRAFMRGKSHILLWVAEPNRLQLLSLASDKVVAEILFASISSDVVTCKVDPSGNFAATLHDDGSVNIWNLHDTK